MRHKCLAAFIVLILYFSITTFVCLVEFKILTKPKTITTTLAESGIYENLPKFIEQLYVKDKKTDLQTKILITGLIKSINPQVIKAEIEKNSESFLNYLNGKTTTPNVTFDLQDLKSNLKNNLPGILTKEMVNLPACAPGIEPNPSGNSGLPECIPQGTTPEQMQQAMQTSNYVDEIVKEIPDTYSLGQIKNIDKTFANIKLAFKILNIAYYASIIISLILLGCLALLGRAWWPSIPRWIGVSLILPSGSLLLLNLLSKALPQILSGQIYKGFDPEIVKFINPVIESVNNNTLEISFIYSGVIFAVGLILIVLSYVLPHPPEPKLPAKTPVPQPAQSKS
ncbi:MAG: hypothetical protein U0946_00245 [Patescibacteria group bacterium]|nr:hypothetical protein [Patescibacteria group bacterium]